MKAGLTIIALSGVGFALLSGIVWLVRPFSPGEATNATRATALTTHESSRVVRAPAQAFSFRWSSLESTNYKEYIANLRHIGCPEDTIRDIIVADISKLYTPREAPFKTKLAAQNTTDGLSIAARQAARRAESELWRQLREIQKEKNALLKQLLGITLPVEPLRATPVRNTALFEAAFNALSSEKRETVRDIQENYWLAVDALSDKYNGKRTPDYLAEQKRLDLDRNAQLARVLSAEEIELFEMRTSNVSVALRESLESFNPSAEEYRAIWRARKQSEDAKPGRLRPTSGADIFLSYSERPPQTNVQIKAVLGEQRFAEYERSQDPTYRSLTQLAERYGLPPATALKGYEVQKTYREQRERLLVDSAVTPEQRMDTLGRLKAEANRSMAEAFGETAARAFQRYGIHDFDSGDEEQ